MHQDVFVSCTDAPNPQNVGEVIYEYVDHKIKVTFSITKLVGDCHYWSKQFRPDLDRSKSGQIRSKYKIEWNLASMSGHAE